MAIKTRNMHRRSQPYVAGAIFWMIPVTTVANSTYHCSAVSVGTAGSSIALAQNWTRTPQSLLVTPGGTPAGANIVIRLTGFNQFGIEVTEDITFAAATAVYTTYCYTKLSSVVVVTQGGWTSPTISIGYQAQMQNGYIPLLSENCPAAAIKSVSGNIGTAALAFTVDTTKKTIKITTSVSGSHLFCVMLDPALMGEC